MRASRARPSAGLRDLRAHAPDGRARVRFAPRRRRPRRRLRALPGRGARARLAQGGQPDHADDAASRGAAAGAPRAISRACGVRARDRRRSSPEPILRRLSEPELAMVEAADLFNVEPVPAHRRRDREEPRLSRRRQHRAALGRDAGELVVTIAWELSWYQYRVSLDSAQPVRLERARPRPRRARDVVHGSGTRTSTTTAGSSGHRAHLARTERRPYNQRA